MNLSKKNLNTGQDKYKWENSEKISPVNTHSVHVNWQMLLTHSDQRSIGLLYKSKANLQAAVDYEVISHRNVYTLL